MLNSLAGFHWIGAWHTVVMALCCCLATQHSASAEPRLLRLRLVGDQAITGTLVPVDARGCVGIQSRCFEQPFVIPAANVLEASTEESANVSTSSNDTSDRHAVDTVAGNRWVGRLLAGDENQCVIERLGGQRLTLPIDRLVAISVASAAPRLLHSLATARHRLRLDDGWEFDADGSLAARRPGDAAVAALDLPDRFVVNVALRTTGQADFEWTLGDVAPNRRERQGRLGGSVSRLPSERLVTRMEWFGDSATVVRSNASVSDSSVFPVRETGMDLKLYVDQIDGRLMAFLDGQQVGTATLTDDEPLRRGDLTMINRGDDVRVRRLDVFAWDGIVPPSRSLPQRFTLLRDGTVIAGGVTAWGEQIVRVASEEFPRRNVLKTVYGRSPQPSSPQPSSPLRFEFADGSIVWGTPQADADAWTIASEAGSWTLDPSAVTAIRNRNRIDEKSGGTSAAVLSCGDDHLEGVLVPGPAFASGFGWRVEPGGQVLEIVERSGASIRWPSRAAAAAAENTDRLELIDGDRIPGRVIQISAAGVRFDGDAFGPVDVPGDRILGVRLREMKSPPSKEAMELVLRLPRRQKQDPPSHLVYSVTGDVLRGNLLSLDGQRARIVVRDKTRVIARETIARIDWLGDSPTQPQACRYVLTAHDGAALGLKSAALSGGVMTLEHAVMGQGRVEESLLKTFHFGDRDVPPTRRPKLRPVKQPRTFEDEPRQTDRRQ